MAHCQQVHWQKPTNLMMKKSLRVSQKLWASVGRISQNFTPFSKLNRECFSEVPACTNAWAKPFCHFLWRCVFQNWLASVFVWDDCGWLWVAVEWQWSHCGWKWSDCGNLWWRAGGIGFVKWMWWVVWTTVFTSPQLCELIDWLIDHESKQASHHQQHVVPNYCFPKKKYHSTKKLTHWASHSAHVHGCSDANRCQNKSDQNQKTREEGVFCAIIPWCICCQNAGQGLHTDPEATCGFVQMKVQNNIHPFNNQLFNQGIPLLPQEDWPQNRKKWNSPSNPWKGSACSTLPWKVQWWLSIILLHGWGGILCFNVVCVWLFTSKQANNCDGSSN